MPPGAYAEARVMPAAQVCPLPDGISFEEGAVDELIRRAVDTGHQAGALASQLVKKLEYGLKLVKDRSGVDHFVVTKDAVLDMDKYINELVKRYYRKEYCAPQSSDDLNRRDSE